MKKENRPNLDDEAYECRFCGAIKHQKQCWKCLGYKNEDDMYCKECGKSHDRKE